MVLWLPILLFRRILSTMTKKYICELCKKESDISMECCGSPMKLVEEAIPEQQETASQEQPAAEA